MYDVIVIGGGVAGITSAIYLRRANKNVLVLETKVIGGQIVNANRIENYPACPNISGYELADNLYKQAKELGVVIKFEEVIDLKNGKEKIVITNKNEYHTLAIIIATGESVRKLGFEDRLIGKGVSYCATCDGNFYKGKIVAVVGGGNTAIDDALYLSNLATKVYLIHRRNTFKADQKSIDLLKKKNNIKYVLNSNITKINGNNHLESIEVVNDKKKMTFKIDGLFIAIGHIPNTEIFQNIISLDTNGYIKATKNCHTNKPGIFAAGDVRCKELRQLVTATNDGAIAASEAIKYLNK